MEMIKIEREVPKEFFELADGLAEMVLVVKKALDDGFQPGMDMPVIVMEAFHKLGPAVTGVASLPAEAKAAPFGVAECFLVAGEKVVKSL